MKMLEDFPFMRDHLHNFEPAHYAQLHECLAKAYEMGQDSVVEVDDPGEAAMNDVDADKEQV